MAANASVFQSSRWGAEIAPGANSLAVYKKLLSFSLDVDPKIPSEIVHPMGQKYATGAIIGKEHVEAAGKGNLAYNDLSFIWSSLLAKGSKTGDTWTYRSSQTDVDDVQTFTVEYGSSVNACKFNYGLVTEFDMDITPTKADMTFKMLGQIIQDNIVLTTDPVDVALQTVSPRDLSFYVSDDDVTYTKLLRVMSLKYGIKNRFSPFFTVNSSLASFSEHIETAPEAVCQLQVEKNSISDGFMTDLRAATQKFAKIVATGPTVDGITYGFVVNFPFVFREPKRAVADNLQTATFDMLATYNPDFDTTGGALLHTVTNAIDTLT